MGKFLDALKGLSTSVNGETSEAHTVVGAVKEISKGLTGQDAEGKNLTEVLEFAAENYEGGGLDITVAPVSDVVLDSEGVLSWTAGDYSNLEEYDYNISYIINVNDNEVSTYDTSLNIEDYLSNDATVLNTISITAAAEIYLNKDSETETITTYYSKKYIITTLDTTLPQALFYMGAVLVDTDIYIFGGMRAGTPKDTIYKFDTTSETITTLDTTLPVAVSNPKAVLVGTDIYILGDKMTGDEPVSIIYKFDTTSETITTLDTTLPVFNYSAVSLGTDIYILGGQDPTTLSTVTTIYKFDTTSETITTLDTTLVSQLIVPNTALVGTDIYIFEENGTTIYKFDTTSETITTLDTTLPASTNTSTFAALDTNIYIFIGNSVTTIYKFDTTSETISTLTKKIYSNVRWAAPVTVNSNIYLFGGAPTSATNKIIKIVVNE